MTGWGYHLGAAAWFVLVNALLLWGCGRITRSYFRIGEPIAHLLATVVLYSTSVVFSMIVFGTLGLALGKWSFGVASLVFLIGLAAGPFAGNGLKAAVPPEPLVRMEFWELRTARAILTLAISISLLSLWRAIRSPSIDVDSLTMYLPQAAEWALNGKLPMTYARGLPWAYPHHFIGLNAWFFLPFRAETMAVALQGIFQGLAVFYCYQVVVLLTGNRLAGACSSLLLAAVPELFWFANRSQVDGTLMAWFIFGLYFTALYYRVPRWAFLVFAALSAGFCAGGKTTGIGYALLLGIVFACVNFGKWGLQKWLGRVAAWGGLTLFAGGFWYVRMWNLYGNPLYPVHIQLFGLDLFPWHEADVPLDMTILNHIHLLYDEWVVLFEKASLLPFIIPIAFLLALGFVLRSQFMINCSIWARLGFLLIAPFGAFLLYANCPMSAGGIGRDLDISFGFRYGFVFLASGAILVGLVGAFNSRFQWVLVAFSLASAVIAAFLISKIILVITIVVMLDVVSPAGRYNITLTTLGEKLSSKFSKPFPKGIIVSCLILSCLFFAGFSKWREQVRYSSPVYGYQKVHGLGEAWYWVDLNSQPGDLIAFDGGGQISYGRERRLFPLLGAPVSRSVLQIEEQIDLLDLKKIFLQRKPSLFVLSRNLSAPDFSRNLKLARAMPDLFEEVLGNKKAVVFRVKIEEQNTSGT